MTADATAARFPPADPERRFLAFALDRLVAWSLYAGAGWAAWTLYWSEGRVWPGVGVLAGTVVVVPVASAVLLGLTGLSLGRWATGLRVVGQTSGEPVGVVKALLRTLVLGLATLPTFGIGAATLAWTALMDPGEKRRAWHDNLAGSVVVDVRPQPEPGEAADDSPRQIVNLTAMRLVPAAVPPTPEPAAQAPAPVRPAPQTPAPVPAAHPAPAASVAAESPREDGVRQRLGGPLGSPARPDEPPPVPAAAPAPSGERRAGRHRGAGDRTSSRPRAGVPTWRVTFDSGETVLVEGLLLVGRKPEPRAGEPVRHVVALSSTDMSLSKTHAQLHLADGVLVVVDRGSTNGSVLNRRGVARDLAPGRPTTLVAGDRVRFGDREMRVEQQP